MMEQKIVLMFIKTAQKIQKNVRRTSHLWGVSLIALSVVWLSCLESKNPLSGKYGGDYAIAIKANASLDSAAIFEPCTFRCTVGSTEFLFLKVTVVPDVAVATKIDYDEAGWQVSLTFLETFNGVVKVTGVCPNLNEVTSEAYPLIVKNPYTIISKPARTVPLADSVLLSIGSSANAFPLGVKKLTWHITGSEGTRDTSVNPADTLRYTRETPGVDTAIATLVYEDTISFVVGSTPITFGGGKPSIDTGAFAVDTTTTWLNHYLVCSGTVLSSDPDTVWYTITLGSDTLLKADMAVLKSGGNAFSLTANRAFSFEGDTAITFTVTNKNGYRAILRQPVTILKNKPTITIDTIKEVATGDTAVIRVKDASGKILLYYWVFSRAPGDTVITQNGVLDSGRAPYYADSLAGSTDTLRVWAVDEYKQHSATIKVVIKPTRYTYQLKIDDATFPSVIPARRKINFSVTLFRDDSIVSGDDALFTWMRNDTVLNSDSAMVEIYSDYRVSAPTFTLGVQAQIGSEKTLLKEKTVTIRRYGPTCTVSSSADSVQAYSDTVLFTFTANDSGPDPVVAPDIFYQFSAPAADTTVHVLDGTVLQKVFKQTGLYTISAWAVDVDNFKSAVAEKWITVFSDTPSFKHDSVAVDGFVNESITFDAATNPGNYTILKYYWDFNADMTYDDSTDVPILKRTFTEEASMRVLVDCRSENSSSAKQKMVFDVTISKGVPIADSIGIQNKTYYVNDAVPVHLKAHDSHGKLTQVVILSGSTTADTVGIYAVDKRTFDSTVVVTFKRAGLYDLLFFALDDDGFKSASLAPLPLEIDSGTPIIDSIIAKRVYINDFDTLRVVARDNNSVVAYALTIDSAATKAWQTDSTFVKQFSTAGTKKIYAWAKDKDSLVSKMYVGSVEVALGAPIISTVTFEKTVFMNDSVSFTAAFTDSNGSVIKILADWNNDGTYEDTGKVATGSNEYTFKHLFAVKDTGLRTCNFIAYDDDNLPSTMKSYKVTVVPGRPSVIDVQVSTAKIFINDNINFTVNATDENGFIRQVLVDWNNDLQPDDTARMSTDQKTVNYPVPYSFPRSATGAQTINFWVVDEDAMRSAVKTLSVIVHLGKPFISSVAVDSVIYINDSRKFTVTAADTNTYGAIRGYIQKIVADWNGDGIADTTVYSDQTVATFTGLFAHTFATADSGSKHVRFWTEDDDTLTSDVKDTTVQVLVGRPVVEGMNITTVTGNNLFVKDDNVYRVRVRDVNGTPVKVFAAWNGEAAPVESLQVNAGESFKDFTHNYAVNLSGSRAVRFWVRDEDGIRSDSKDTTIFVRLGAPVLSGDKGDTLWAVVDNGPGINYNLHVNSKDTNGTIVRYYWDERGTFDSTTLTADRKTADSVFSRTIGVLEVNNGFPMWIYARDDDGILNGKQFVMYSDSAPPAPLLVAPANQAVVSGDVTFTWKNMDKHDGTGTRYKIMYKKGTTAEVAVGNMEFTAGTNSAITYSAVDGTFSYTASGLPTGTLSWRVIAKDNRGSESTSGVFDLDR